VVVRKVVGKGGREARALKCGFSLYFSVRPVAVC
jgi:predicted RNA-binding protein YlqC (UPF0109 family)